MKLSKLFIGIAAAGMVSAIAVPAQATILDAWQMTVVGSGTTYTNIGFLDLTAGPATVTQEVNSLGQVFTGAKFSESSVTYSISFTPNTTVGPNDTGAPSIFAAADLLTLTVNPATGHVTGTSGGGFSFVFDSPMTTPDTISIQTTAGAVTQATATVNGVGGNFNQIAGFAGGNGASTLNGDLIKLLGGFNLLDSTGTALSLNKLELEATTNNVVALTGGVTGPVACNFTPDVATDGCFNIKVTSSGQLYLQTVPEPATLALLGLGLVGLGVTSRKRKA